MHIGIMSEQESRALVQRHLIWPPPDSRAMLAASSSPSRMHCTGLCTTLIHIHRLTMRLRTLRSPIPKKTTLQGSSSHSSGRVLSSRNRHFGSWAAPGRTDTLNLAAGPHPTGPWQDCSHIAQHSTAQHSTEHPPAQGVEAAAPGTPHHLPELEGRQEEVIARKHDCAAGHVDAECQGASSNDNLQAGKQGSGGTSGQGKAC